MVLSREVTARIKEVLEKHPEGISITALVKSVEVNRNTAGRYLENLLLSGQVEMRRFGMAKMYSLTKRLPVSSVLSISSELVLQLDTGQRVFYANDPLLSFIAVPAKDLFGKNIEFTPFSIVFEEVFPDLLDRIRRGLRGEEWHGELSRPVRGKYFLCRIAPTVTSEGKKGVSVLLEDISDQKRDEERIRKSEARLRSIFMASPVGIGVVAGRVLLEVNDRLCQMTGYSAGELIGRSVRMLYPSEEEFDKVGSLLYNQVQQSGSGAVEIQWARKDGRIIDILLSSTPLDPANISGGITFTALDITERNLASQALRESEDRYRKLVEISPDAVILHCDGKIIYVNPALVRLLRAKSPDDLLGRDVLDLVAPEYRAAVRANIERDLTGEFTPAAELQMLCADGSRVTIEGRGVSTLIDSRPAVLVAITDITERYQTEKKLRESESTARALLNAPTDTIILLDNRGVILDLNETAVQRLGRKREDLVGTLADTVLPPDLAQQRRSKISKVLATGKPTRFMDEHRGTWFDNVVYPIPNPRGNVARLAIIARDITDQKKAESALRESEDRYRSVFENTGAATAIIEENTLVSLMNTEFERISGYTKQEIEKKKSWADFVVKEDLERMLAWHYRRRESGDAPHQYEAGVIKKNGEIRRVLITVGLIPGTSQTVVSLIDITHRQEAEDALRASEQLYRFIADNSLDIITRQTPECICTYVSPAVTPLLGYKVMDVLGKSVLSLVHPDDLPMIQRHLVRILQDNTSQITTTFRMRHKDGHYFWFESMTKIIRDEKTGRIREFLSISRDITARMQRGKESNQGQG